MVEFTGGTVSGDCRATESLDLPVARSITMSEPGPPVNACSARGEAQATTRDASTGEGAIAETREREGLWEKKRQEERKNGKSQRGREGE